MAHHQASVTKCDNNPQQILESLKKILKKEFLLLPPSMLTLTVSAIKYDATVSYHF